MNDMNDMKRLILILNCGSSSVKFNLYRMPEGASLVSGNVEKIGSKDAGLSTRTGDGGSIRKKAEIRNHAEAIRWVLDVLCESSKSPIDAVEEIDAVGHRVVHGGEAFTEATLIDESVLVKIKECVRFAPLHNPANFEGIQASFWLLPFSRQVAVFDTAFHQTMEEDAFLYALPMKWYEQKGIRRYGFHGTSHRYLAKKTAELLQKPVESLKLVTCHLGNGASIAAVDGGRSVDTSMGFTPLEGLMMGTRCGDIDPAILLHVMGEDGWTAEQMDTILNRQSGFYGVTGGDHDLRTVEEKAEAGSRRHGLALSMFTRRIKKYIGAYAAVMNGLDALVFSAGIGENSPTVRRMVCSDLSFLGVELEEAKNEKNARTIHRGRVPVLVLPTDEERAIAEETLDVLRRAETLKTVGVG